MKQSELVPWPAGTLEDRIKNREVDNYQQHIDDVASASDSSDSDSDSTADKSETELQKWSRENRVDCNSVVVDVSSMHSHVN